LPDAVVSDLVALAASLGIAPPAIEELGSR